MAFTAGIELVGRFVETAGVAVIVVGLVAASVRYVAGGSADAIARYRGYRQNLGRSILLGLEILVAGDIIRIVAAEPTAGSVLVLGMIVLIRTFLSMSLELELEGRWPWRRAEAAQKQEPAA